jgi:ribosomal protein L37AE/L43A
MTRSNPWARKHRAFARRYVSPSDDPWNLMEHEAREAERKPRLMCTQCGEEAWYKPTIGTYKCPECGAIRAGGKFR